MTIVRLDQVNADELSTITSKETSQRPPDLPQTNLRDLSFPIAVGEGLEFAHGLRSNASSELSMTNNERDYEGNRKD